MKQWNARYVARDYAVSSCSAGGLKQVFLSWPWQEPAAARADFIEVPYAGAWHRHPVKEAFSRLSIKQ